MPRNNKGPSRGGGRGGRGNRESSKGLVTSFKPFAKTECSMQSEALNTQRHQGSWTSDHKLRHAKIHFVSAGDSKRAQFTDPHLPLAEMTLNESAETIHQDREKTKLNASMEDHIIVIQRKDPINISQSEMDEAFVIDTQGDDPVATGFSTPRIRPASPSPSDSSDEVIVFRGRNNAGKATSRPLLCAEDNTLLDIPNSVVHDKISEQENFSVAQAASREHSTSSRSQSLAAQTRISVASKDGLFSTTLQSYPATTSGAIELVSTSAGRSKKPSKKSRLNQNQRDIQQALFDDYIQNIDDLGSNLETPHLRDLGCTDGDAWQETDMSSGNNFQNLLQTHWDRSDLGNLEGWSTSNGMIGSIQAILSKRETTNGLQYLVIWEGGGIDDARWVPTTTLTEAKGIALIKQFEAEEKLTTEISGEEEKDSDSDSDDDFAEDQELGRTNDDIDLQQRNLDRITDEQIARLLTKQEKFGMGSAALKLYDGSRDIDLYAEDMPLSFAPNASRRQFRNVQLTKKLKGEFPGADGLADAYYGFDILDFERPSLKKKPKGRKGKQAFDLSDSSLEVAMQTSWENDKSKKKQKKMKRQELRTQGLLNKYNNSIDLKVKYGEGMGIHAVKDEIKKFLIGGNTTLALPPMDKADRKIVHEIANAFNLKSKSAGNGQNRFPVLYRTSYTSPYIEGKFVSVEARMTRRYLPRMDLRGKGSPSMPKRTGRGGSNTAGSYRDGDIVGGSAPELGVENKGRAMLEKMGWSTGTALGAVNNKGILQPVSHVVKTTKAGLG